MLRVILTNGRNIDVDADHFYIDEDDLELYRGDDLVGGFNSQYVVGVHEAVPGMVTIKGDEVILEPFKPKATTKEDDR